LKLKSFAITNMMHLNGVQNMYREANGRKAI